MNHNWPDLVRQVAVNAKGKCLDGSPSNWDTALYQLISETYEQPLDTEDEAVLVVLIALHEAVQGKIDLTELAMACIQMSRKGK